jgi:hypothetical protein
MINFYATANPGFANADVATRNAKFQDETYALIQRAAFNDYTAESGPVSTGMTL